MRLYPLGCAIDVRTEHRILAETARQLWPEDSALFPTEPLQFLVRHAPHGGDSLEFTADANRFTFRAGPDVGGWFRRDARRGAIFTDPHSAALLLESVVLTALTWTHLLPIHAGCVTKGDRSVLLCGDSHAGKSTLAYTCARAGWTYVSDNSLYWERDEDRLVSGSPTIKLRGSSTGTDWRIDPGAEGLLAARTAKPGPSVFLARRPGPAVLKQQDQDEALAYFLSYVTRPDRDIAAQHYRDLLQHGAWRIEYEHAEEAARCLEQLL